MAKTFLRLSMIEWCCVFDTCYILAVFSAPFIIPPVGINYEIARITITIGGICAIALSIIAIAADG